MSTTIEVVVEPSYLRRRGFKKTVEILEIVEVFESIPSAFKDYGATVRVDGNTYAVTVSAWVDRMKTDPKHLPSVFRVRRRFDSGYTCKRAQRRDSKLVEAISKALAQHVRAMIPVEVVS